MAPKLTSADMRRETAHFAHNFSRVALGKIDDDYKFAKNALGQGSFGRVLKGTSTVTGITRAIKTIDVARITNAARFEAEVEVQRQMDHPHIVKLFEVFKDAKRVYLVMELCEGGELFDRIVSMSSNPETEGAFNEQDAATFMTQILGAIQYIHMHDFVHRDIKPENFMLTTEKKDAQIKVIDFGLARRYKKGDPLMRTKAGTPFYVAPEVLGTTGYDHLVDIWSCGVIAYVLLCGYPPFYGDSDGEILRAVKQGVLTFPDEDWDDISPQAKSMIKSMLSKAAKTRPEAEAVLQEPWLTNANRPKGRVNKDLGGRLKAFRGTTKLQKVALTCIAQQLSDDRIEELRTTFQLLDKNRDGTLTPQEIRTGMADHKIHMPADLDNMMSSLDSDNSGSIDYSEFLAATLSTRHYLRSDALWSAFRAFDHDGDASIDKNELGVIMKTQSPEAIEAMIAEVDTSGDGKIQFEEFCKMMERNGLDADGIAEP